MKGQPPRTTPEWQTSDFWFGIQHPFPQMVRSLKRLVEQEAKVGAAPAAPAGDLAPLGYYLSKSDLVVAGTIVSEPLGKSSEGGVVTYSCQFKITDVCQGDAALKDTTVRVNIIRFEFGEKDHHPLIAKDSECILFLRRAPNPNVPSWQTADFWFGIEHPFPTLISALKRVVAEEERRAAAP